MADRPEPGTVWRHRSPIYQHLTVEVVDWAPPADRDPGLVRARVLTHIDGTAPADLIMEISPPFLARYYPEPQ